VEVGDERKLYFGRVRCAAVYMWAEENVYERDPFSHKYEVESKVLEMATCLQEGMPDMGRRNQDGLFVGGSCLDTLDRNESSLSIQVRIMQPLNRHSA
jgi:hypothetical protein